jgi:hypothetical protein
MNSSIKKYSWYYTESEEFSYYWYILGDNPDDPDEILFHGINYDSIENSIKVFFNASEEEETILTLEKINLSRYDLIKLICKASSGECDKLDVNWDDFNHLK